MSTSAKTTTTTTPTIGEPTEALAQAPSFAQFAGMVGSSIATRDSTPWVLHFLSAAYYTKADDERQLDDLHLAFAVLTTYWHRLGRPLRATDVHGFHQPFRRARSGSGSHYPAGG